ncbi:hypothetical protein L7F22_066526 [Adiantum nelumboides]|nr:hypothetical protein [Adiantum nelumboides]
METPLRSLFPASQLCSAPLSTFKALSNFALVDAFTDSPFKGNPAGVCILPAWRETYWLQQVASELNVNMTAFLVKREIEPKSNGAAENGNHTLLAHSYEIRWFTPLAEVSLCGHATLASAYLLFGSGIVDGGVIRFHPEKGGVLRAHKVEKASQDGFLIELAFPILPTLVCDFDRAGLSSTLQNVQVLSYHRTSANDLLVELSSHEAVQALTPCFDEIKNGDFRGLIVTGKTSNQSLGCDFMSRFFAPKVGIDEDPVCGQAHCALAPFWGNRLEKSNLVGYQASKRGGTLHLRVDFDGGQVYLQGEATLIMSGVLFL